MSGKKKGMKQKRPKFVLTEYNCFINTYRLWDKLIAINSKASQPEFPGLPRFDVIHFYKEYKVYLFSF